MTWAARSAGAGRGAAGRQGHASSRGHRHGEAKLQSLGEPRPAATGPRDPVLPRGTPQGVRVAGILGELRGADVGCQPSTFSEVGAEEPLDFKSLPPVVGFLGDCGPAPRDGPLL